jgi:hypothetical protein
MKDSAKTWQEKMRCDMEPQIKSLGKAFAGFKVGDRMLIPTPMMIQDYIHSIPAGQTRTIKEMRDDLAKSQQADLTCPLCAGIFSRIVAEAAYEELSQGNAISQITPFWRILEPKGPLRKKLSFDYEFADQQLAAEAG